MKVAFNYLVYFIVFISFNNNIYKNNIYSDSIPIINSYRLNIPSINLNENFYDFYNNQNDVNKNIYLASDYNFNSFNGALVLAAHSGNSNISYFDKLNLLKQGDVVIISFGLYNYVYEIYDIYLINKNGLFNYNDKNRTIYLITCSKNNNKKQLVLYGKMVKIIKKSSF